MKPRVLDRRWYFRFFLHMKLGRKLFLSKLFLVDCVRRRNLLLAISSVFLLNAWLITDSFDMNGKLTVDTLGADDFVWALFIIIWLLSACVAIDKLVAFYVIKLCYKLYLLRLENKVSFKISGLVADDFAMTLNGSLIRSDSFLSRKYVYDSYNSNCLVACPLPDDFTISDEGYDLLLNIYDYTKFFDDLRPIVKGMLDREMIEGDEYCASR